MREIRNFTNPCLSLEQRYIGGGEFIKSVGEENQVVKRVREYHGCGEEFNVEKKKRGSNTIFPIILRLIGRISSGEEWKEK